MSPRISGLLFNLTLCACSVIGSLHAAEIFRCTDAAGAITFSDRSCHRQAQQKITLEPMPIVGWEKVEPSQPSRGAGRKRRIHKVDSGRDDDMLLACADNAQRIDKINSRMRAGYTLKTGERLRERLRELESFRFRNCR